MPKRSRKDTDPAAKELFKGTGIVVVVKEKSPVQAATWRRRLGEALQGVFTASEVYESMAVDEKTTHVVCAVEWEEALAEHIDTLIGSRTVAVVAGEWLYQAIGRHAFPVESDHRWKSSPNRRKREGAATARFSDDDDDDDEEEVVVFAKYACMRATTVEGNVNSRITGYLCELGSWWEFGILDADEEGPYRARVAILCKIVSLLKVWPVELTPQTWSTERRKLAKQYHVDERSTSKNGGWLVLLDALVAGKEPTRPDTVEKWSADPRRRAVRGMRLLKCGIGREEARRLEDRGVSGGEDLVARRDDPDLDVPENVQRALRLALVGPSARPMDETETLAFVGALLAAAAAASLKAEIVGSYRRGKIGGHDLDILLAPQCDPSVDTDRVPPQREIRDAHFDDFFATLALSSPLGVQEELRGIGHGKVKHSKRDDRLIVRHVVFRSLAVPGAFRHVDVVLAPPSIWAHALLGWSGSRNFQRSIREFTSHCHDHNWRDTKGIEIKGKRGWNLDANGERTFPAVEGRALDLRRREHWHWSQAGLFIVSGSTTSKDRPILHLYEEDNAHFQKEADIFHFFGLDYRAPRERCA
ncbi:hypothetical protein CTAYLR_003664 [Chrysophaeum taylorii]|uniref:DNA-directed DNA polymerase X domain-containing protein n=1 Tax=Chrysophaeum taylorii TaxID=2483200 RepID=A0AAD7UC50_9STRA|nr:hypothetical protein CTAYLR_003664 [Chrysophaeum taylorii]